MPKSQRTKEFYVIAHNIRSLLNVGSIFRTADAFGVTKIYLTGYTGTPENPVHKNKISKSALGAENWVPWEHRPSAAKLIKELKQNQVQIIALENNVASQDIKKFKPKFPAALLLGEEVKGIAKPLLKACDAVVEIPMVGKKESLNVSVAFGIAAYELTK
ncbi:MAG: RNA methyltransferase [Candidatus Doudnabacteria bacterium]|nr:RNA methyltransferase [Candidatus Doudnabacteria bacterium]